MLLPLSGSRWFFAVVVTVGVLATGCGADRSGGPKGTAAEIVGRATEKTLAAGRARFDVAVPRQRVQGRVDLSASTLTPNEPWPAEIPLVAEPETAVALVRGAVDVVSYGGQAIRGIGVFRYEVDLAPDKALRDAPASARPALEALVEKLEGPTMFADVWVDDQGRIRRVQMPLNPNQTRPRGYSKVTPDYVTVDLYDFAKGGGDGQ